MSVKEIENISIGDEVFVFSVHNTILKTVQNVTKKYVLVDGVKYRKSDGIILGYKATDCNISYIQIPTEEELRKQKEIDYKHELVEKLHNFKGYGKFPLKKLETLCSLLGIET